MPVPIEKIKELLEVKPFVPFILTGVSGINTYAMFDTPDFFRVDVQKSRIIWSTWRDSVDRAFDDPYSYNRRFDTRMIPKSDTRVSPDGSEWRYSRYYPDYWFQFRYPHIKCFETLAMLKAFPFVPFKIHWDNPVSPTSIIDRYECWLQFHYSSPQYDGIAPHGINPEYIVRFELDPSPV